MTGLSYDDAAPAPELPPTSEEIERGMTTTSIKLPEEMRDRLREVASEHCIPQQSPRARPRIFTGAVDYRSAIGVMSGFSAAYWRYGIQRGTG